MEVKFREASEADSATLAGLLGVLGYPTTDTEVRMRLELLENDSDGIVIVADTGSKVVAFASLAFMPFFHLGQTLCRVSAIVVDAAYQGRGVGRRLMGEVERIARDRECASVEITSSGDRSDAHRFYNRLGYKQNSLKFRKRLD